ARWPRPLPAAASGAGDAVADRVAVLVHDGDLPAGARGPGRRDGPVTGQGGVQGAEQPALPRPGRLSLQGDQRDRHLGQRPLVPAWAQAVAAVTRAVAAAVTRP